MVYEILTERMCTFFHQLFVYVGYELVMQHDLCAITCVHVGTLQRVSEYSKGCHTTPNGVEVIL